MHNLLLIGQRPADRGSWSRSSCSGGTPPPQAEALQSGGISVLVTAPSKCGFEAVLFLSMWKGVFVLVPIFCEIREIGHL